ncbi:DUF2515 family protein [Bacillus sp. EAC]|uniref:DUF2515 family protein n=1 Tax=Bacillus sp. EAC TaxID=1978338 RepID=UPI000B435CE5|nr:DUF2515 family protein [Bacillus sp. EAC]
MTVRHDSWKEYIRNRRNGHSILSNENELIELIQNETTRNNRDNISRTIAYQDYFFRMKDIHWSFLASMVSRNAGYNMTDLKQINFKNGLSEKQRKQLFLTYERANWIIFQDAFPQLLIFEYSMINNNPLFYLLKYFSVSSFMEIEWEKYWTDRDKVRLVFSLIINEQNMIEKPVIQDPYFKNEVFDSLSFKLQEQLKLSSVVFPTLTGELYGLPISQFQELTKRIQIGKQLYSILFKKDLTNHFIDFAKSKVHTGSRSDYEEIIGISKSNNPKLRDVYPMIPHRRNSEFDWYDQKKIELEWYKSEEYLSEYNYKETFLIKQEVMVSLLKMKSFFQ